MLLCTAVAAIIEMFCFMTGNAWSGLESGLDWSSGLDWLGIGLGLGTGLELGTGLRLGTGLGLRTGLGTGLGLGMVSGGLSSKAVMVGGFLIQDVSHRWNRIEHGEQTMRSSGRGP